MKNGKCVVSAMWVSLVFSTMACTGLRVSVEENRRIQDKTYERWWVSAEETPELGEAVRRQLKRNGELSVVQPDTRSGEAIVTTDSSQIARLIDRGHLDAVLRISPDPGEKGGSAAYSLELVDAKVRSVVWKARLASEAGGRAAPPEELASAIADKLGEEGLLPQRARVSEPKFPTPPYW